MIVHADMGPSWERRQEAELASARKRRDAYTDVGWDALSPYARGEIDRLARADGVTLHAGSDAETLRKYINRYRISW